MKTLKLRGYHHDSSITIEYDDEKDYGNPYTISVEEGAGSAGTIELDASDMLKFLGFVVSS